MFEEDNETSYDESNDTFPNKSFEKRRINLVWLIYDNFQTCSVLDFHGGSVHHQRLS